MDSHFCFYHSCHSFAYTLIVQTAINFIRAHITFFKKMLNPIDRFLLFRFKFGFSIWFLIFKRLRPAFQPLKALVGGNGKTDVFCPRRKTVFDLMYDSYIRVLCISLHLQDASCCCHNINAAKAAVQPFGAFFFVEVANQNDGAVIARSPHSKAAHKFPCPACDLQIGITAKISLNRVDHDQTWPEFNDCLTDALIVQCEAVINLFIDESNLPAVCPAAFQSGLYRIRNAILGALINHFLRHADLTAIRGLSIRTTKLTGKVLAAALGKVARALQKHHRKALTPQGRQSVKKLMNHYGGKSAMPYVGAPKDFDRIAKEFHVDYAFHKVSPGHYLLFFKANQADAITAAFQKYSAKVLNKEQDKASILGQLRKFTEQIRTQAKEKQRTREAVKDGR